MDAADPGPDCPLCPRLVQLRQHMRTSEPDWFNAPVPTFGRADAKVLIVGLAPGLRGANRTGRPFTGDYAGDLLYSTLLEVGFAAGSYGRRPDDNLHLQECAVTNAVRCVPPMNKPSPTEIRNCQVFLDSLVTQMSRLTTIVALGRVAHDSVLRVFGARVAAFSFGHARRHDLAKGSRSFALFDSYHCSRYNTNTGVLTESMFRQVFETVRTHLESN